MTRALVVDRAAPGLSVQDLGRPGYLTYGLSRGGAADPQAVFEGAALLGQDPGLAVIEMAAVGGAFTATEDMRIALTGAPMRATRDGERLAWNASHALPAGAKLAIGPAEAGVYGYLSLGGGVMTAPILGSRSTHAGAGIGHPLAPGTRLPVGPDKGGPVSQRLSAEPRFDGGTLRVIPSLQTGLFDAAEIARFEATAFRTDGRGNRMGVRLLSDGAGFGLSEGLSILSEVIVPGDIQITGDGTPFVLLSECQTVGGYPRIGSVLPVDRARAAQAAPGAKLRFAFVSLEQATEIERRAAAARAALPGALEPLVRDPHEMRDLLSYQLISGVTAGAD